MSEPEIVWAEDYPGGTYDLTDHVSYVINAGAVVVFPTDTLYGLLASAWDEEGKAYHRVYRLKGRTFDKPLALLISEGEEFWRFAKKWCQSFHGADKLHEEFESGKATLLLPPQALPTLPSSVATLQPGTVGVRCPQRSLIRDVVDGTANCLFATSVNRSGQPPATTADEVLAWLDELRARGIDPPELVVLSRTPGSGKPSRVVDLTGDEPQWIR